jgi:hypothetical protein
MPSSRKIHVYHASASLYCHNFSLIMSASY